jgi:hypothetical protein
MTQRPRRAVPNRYTQIIERIFFSHYQDGTDEVAFEREDIVRVAEELGIKHPRNLGDVVYSFRYRGTLPESVRARAPEGKEWIIRPAGRSRYCFVATTVAAIVPTQMMAETKGNRSAPPVEGPAASLPYCQRCATTAA